MEDKVNLIKTVIDEFNEHFQRPGMEKISLDGVYILKKDWKNKWLCKEGPGVYIFLNEIGDVEYIGKSYYLPKRLNCHFHYDTIDKNKPMSVTYASKDTSHV